MGSKIKGRGIMGHSKNLTRRHFVMSTAAASLLAAAGVAGCSPSSQEGSEAGSSSSGSASDESTDVVIVGGGFSGMTAAVTLSDHYPDLNFILLEQEDSLGGSLQYSDGYFIGFSEDYNEDPTSTATAEQMVDLANTAAADVIDNGYAERDTEMNEELAENVYSQLPELVDELFEMGVPFATEIDLDSPYSQPEYTDEVYSVNTDDLGAGFANAVIEYIEGNGIDVRTNSQVTELVVEDGTVTGVKVSSNDGDYTITASAVLMAMGGFAANSDKIDEYLPDFSDVSFFPNPGATGMAIDFTQQFDTPMVSDGVFGGVVADDDSYVITACNFLVNEEGARFTDESQNWYVLLWPVIENTQAASGWCICDATYAEENADEVDPKLEAGSMIEYDSIEALCEGEGIDQAGLEASIEAYNAAVDAGEDPEFGLPVDSAHKVETAPFYAEKTTTYAFGTIRSIQVNEQCQVLDGDGAAVPGLFATGETAVGNVIFGQYPGGGSGNSFAGNSGRYAAIAIAESL